MDLYRLRSLMFGEARCGREAQASTLHYVRLNPDCLSISFRRRRGRQKLELQFQPPGDDRPQEPIEPLP